VVASRFQKNNNSIHVFSYQATGYASQHTWFLSQARINWEGCVRKGILRKNGVMAEVGAPISLDVVAVHPDCWCICLCYLRFATENPEDGVMYLLVPAHPGCPGQSPQSRKMAVCVCIQLSMCLSVYIDFSFGNFDSLAYERNTAGTIYHQARRIA